MRYEPKEVDYSTPYKTFNDLKNGDKVYMINYKDLSIMEYVIMNYSKKDISNYSQKNHYEINFEILYNEKDDKWSSVHLYSDGNSLIGNGMISSHYVYGRKEMFFTSDERIADIIITILRERNTYQWNSFHQLFGRNPQNNEFRDIKYC